MDKQYLFTIFFYDYEEYELVFTGTLERAETLRDKLNRHISWGFVFFHEIRDEVTA